MRQVRVVVTRLGTSAVPAIGFTAATGSAPAAPQHRPGQVSRCVDGRVELGGMQMTPPAVQLRLLPLSTGVVAPSVIAPMVLHVVMMLRMDRPASGNHRGQGRADTGADPGRAGREGELRARRAAVAGLGETRSGTEPESDHS